MKKPCFEVITRKQVVKMKIVIEPLRNSYETLSTQNPIFLRNFQYWLKFLASYIRMRAFDLKREL